jgi:hypothetical protein
VIFTNGIHGVPMMKAGFDRRVEDHFAISPYQSDDDQIISCRIPASFGMTLAVWYFSLEGISSINKITP